MNNLLAVAKLGRVVGLKGALKLHNTSDFIEQFKKGAKFSVEFSSAFKTCNNEISELSIKSFDSKTNLVIFENYESPELASKLVNAILKRSLEDTRKYCKLKQGEFFYFDIIGCSVSENNQNLGIIEDIMQVGGGFLFLLKTLTLKTPLDKSAVTTDTVYLRLNFFTLSLSNKKILLVFISILDISSNEQPDVSKIYL